MKQTLFQFLSKKDKEELLKQMPNLMKSEHLKKYQFAKIDSKKYGKIWVITNLINL